MEKDPVQINENHNKKIDEIFGKISKFFKNNSKNSQTPEYQEMISRMDSIEDSDELCKYHSATVTGQIANTNVSGNRYQKRLKIDDNKEIIDFSKLKFEYVDHSGNGRNQFYPARYADFKCYDIEKDVFGIAWLFDPSAKYKALSIGGNLKANIRNQSVDFNGIWSNGDFYGDFKSNPMVFYGNMVTPPSSTTTSSSGSRPIIPPAGP